MGCWYLLYKLCLCVLFHLKTAVVCPTESFDWISFQNAKLSLYHINYLVDSQWGVDLITEETFEKLIFHTVFSVYLHHVYIQIKFWCERWFALGCKYWVIYKVPGSVLFNSHCQINNWSLIWSTQHDKGEGTLVEILCHIYHLLCYSLVILLHMWIRLYWLNIWFIINSFSIIFTARNSFGFPLYNVKYGM